MSSFTEPLQVEQVSGDIWKTLRKISYYTNDKNTLYTIPSGFHTDFASIPRILWTIVGHPAGKYAQAAVLHDYLYKIGALDRKQADLLFLEAMEVLKVRYSQRYALYWGVRIGGWAAWNSHRDNQNEKR